MMIDKKNALKARTYIEDYYILDVEHFGKNVITYRVEDMKYNREVLLYEYFPESIAKRHHKSDEQSTVYVHPTQSEQFHVGKIEFNNLYNNLKMVNHPLIPVVYELFESSGTLFASTKYSANTKTLRHHLTNSAKIFLEQQIGMLALSIVRAFVLLQQRELQICLLNPETLVIDNITKEPILAYVEYMSFDKQAIGSLIHQLGMLLYEIIDKENFKNSEPLQPLKPNKASSSALCGLVNRMISDDTSKHFKTFQELQTLLQSYESIPAQCERTQSEFSSYLSLASVILVIIFIYNIFTQAEVDAKNLTWFDSMRYHLVAYSGNVKGQSALGQMYEKGYSVDVDMKEAIVWYKKAAQQGDVDAQLSLAYIYRNVEGEKDDKKALEIFSKLARRGNLDAQKKLGYSYMTGERAAQNYKQAMYWFQKAQEQGDAYSCGAIGWMYSSGLGVEKNLQQALYWFKKGVERNDKYSKNEIAGLEKKIERLAQASLHQESIKEYNLGHKWERGTTGHEDHKKAIKHYKKAIKLGNIKAKFRLAQVYERSEQIARDYSSALYWYKKAAEHGDALAYYRVSKLYRAGHGVKKDDKLALQWCKEAAERGLGVAQGIMGSSYEFGWGTDVSYSKARYWYELAIESGYQNAIGRLEKLNKKEQEENEVVIVNREQQPNQIYVNRNNSNVVSNIKQQPKQSFLNTNSSNISSVKVRACQACHGRYFDKRALGKSMIVANMSSRQIAIALKGYKNGTYGGPMKAIMRGQVARYSDSALEVFSKSIGR